MAARRRVITSYSIHYTKLYEEEGFSILLRVLNPITPHICHALWRDCGFGDDILSASWPQVDEAALVQDEIELMLQINGKLRGSLKVAADAPRRITSYNVCYTKLLRLLS